MSTPFTICYHLGAPHTNDDLVVWSLRKQPGLSKDRGVFVPRPRHYRTAIVEAAADLRGEPATAEFQRGLLTKMLGYVDHDSISRLILSSDNFLSFPAHVFQSGGFYMKSGDKARWMRNLFPDNPCEFHLAIVNPATFIPSIFNTRERQSYEAFMNGTPLHDVRWSPVIERIRDANPDCLVTVWCNEDSPVVWSTVLHELAGTDFDTEMLGGLDIVERIMTGDGFERLKQYLSDRDFLNEVQRREVIGIFLEKYADPDAVEAEVDLPGWNDQTIAALTQLYEEDITRIERMRGVDFIEP